MAIAPRCYRGSNFGKETVNKTILILLLILINNTIQHGGVPKHLKLKPFGHHQVSMNNRKANQRLLILV